MLRSAVAVASGFAVTALLVMVFTALSAVVFGLPLTREPTQALAVPGSGYMAANLVTSLLAAVAGGWTTARLAAHHPRQHALALAVLLAVLGVLSLRTPQPGQPEWYLMTLVVLGPAGVLLGGMLHRRPAAAPVAASVS